MIKYLLIFVLYLECSNKMIIKNGVFNILANKHYLFYHNGTLNFSKYFKYPNTFFRIQLLYKTFNCSFYNIEPFYIRSKLTIIKNKELFFNTTKNNFSLWTFLKTGENEYIIKNKNNCYLKILSFKPSCNDVSIYDATKFQLFRIFSEVKHHTYNDSKLLEQEPIDVLIKYIDLRDPNLKRNGIHQIEKDYDNEELRYSIRSILMNIPWIRKIYILMPNQKVRFFKKYKYIKNKIVYVKDKDILGYESSNSNSFQFIFWKLKKYGISDNIIVMDDDYFIGKKLEKNDFFYVQNGKIFPIIITSKFMKLDKIMVKKQFELFKIKAKNSQKEQGEDIFNYSKYLTILFIFELFNFNSKKEVFIPRFTHNAIPINLNDIKEIYDLIDKSENKYSTLVCNYRKAGYFQFQIFALLYAFIKYDRKVKNIPSKYIHINNQNFKNYKFPLFCINKGSGNYSYLDYLKSKLALEIMFPIPTPFEKTDFSFINSSFNVIFNYTNLLKKEENLIYQSSKLKYFYCYKAFFIIFFFAILYKKIHQFLIIH